MKDTALISVAGPDAAPFLHAQLTSDLLALRPVRTQYSGYCSPKGRLLATFLVWRLENEILLQLPATIGTSIRERLQKYVLRSKVTLADASTRFRIYGLTGEDAEKTAATPVVGDLSSAHDVVADDGMLITRLSSCRCLVLAPADDERDACLENASGANHTDSEAWSRFDIAAGIPWITEATQDQFVPQMVNLDLLGGVNFSKGCYPGQEIVARMHYLGRLKQRMYRFRLPAPEPPRTGDALFSPRFGADQSCGTVVNIARGSDGTYVGLAVVQMESVRDGAVYCKSLDGPALDFLPLPYSIHE